MEKKITVLFYKTSQGNEPVRDWLKDLSAVDRLMNPYNNAATLTKAANVLGKKLVLRMV